MFSVRFLSVVCRSSISHIPLSLPYRFSFMRFAHAKDSEIMMLGLKDNQLTEDLEPISVRNEIKVLTELAKSAAAALMQFDTTIEVGRVLCCSREKKSDLRALCLRLCCFVFRTKRDSRTIQARQREYHYHQAWSFLSVSCEARLLSLFSFPSLFLMELSSNVLMLELLISIGVTIPVIVIQLSMPRPLNSDWIRPSYSFAFCFNRPPTETNVANSCCLCNPFSILTHSLADFSFCFRRRTTRFWPQGN